MTGYRYTGHKASAIRAVHQAWIDAQPATTRCGFCRWTHIGTALEGRDAYHTHRTTAHPEVQPKRIRRSTLGRWISRDSDQSFRDEGNANAAEVAAMHERRSA